MHYFLSKITIQKCSVMYSTNCVPNPHQNKATFFHRNLLAFQKPPVKAKVVCQAEMPKNSILWFRKGLRLHDNPALLEAINRVNYFYPIFIIDPNFIGPQRVGVTRYNFLLECLQDLNASLEARGTRLLVLRGNPVEVFPKIFKDWDVSHLCFEYDTEPYAKRRDVQIRELANKAGVEVYSPISNTLYDMDKLVSLNGGETITSYGNFRTLAGRLGEPPVPVGDPPSSIPPFQQGAVGTDTKVTSIPTLQEMGYEPIPNGKGSPLKGGESVALSKMLQKLSDKQWVIKFEKPQTDPTAFTDPATTTLSPYIKFGCLSVRLFYHKLRAIEKSMNDKCSQPPVSLVGQLIWREFNYMVSVSNPQYDRMEGNTVCRQIPWDDNEEFYKAWEEGRTGYPWIDACMIQLQQWGWMHHLARHCVACFLTRGDLWQSWERGRDTFDRLLVDADPAINNFNWQWLSASAFFHQYFRVYSPINFGKKYDPEGHFVKHFLPQLRGFPKKYIYEPWKAPMTVQKAAGCIIGKDYPEPIVDHEFAKQENLERMKLAYAENRELKEVEKRPIEKPKSNKGSSKASSSKKVAT
eukprot:TRINITY_DN2438_c0_g2_i4.p1 TRINITY_DN2438_c0_g2~~TRINITY_DN2438_c0_g2_i4.p1  ORF type:complete len:579 (+),score=41.45 TRINITY_DN2438_c0_g2_i4:679-2415(+)